MHKQLETPNVAGCKSCRWAFGDDDVGLLYLWKKKKNINERHGRLN